MRRVASAAAPLATSLEGGDASVPAYDAQLNATYATQTFAGVDLDAWAEVFLGAVDRVLTPDVATLVAAAAPATYDDLMLAKSVVAQALAAGVEPVYDPGTSGVLPGDPVAAREAFEQAVLARLADGYGIAAVVQVPTTVAASVAAVDPVRLFGSVDGATTTGAGLTLSAAKLPLAAGSTQLTFLASVADGGAAANATLPLAWTPGFAEQPDPGAADAYGYEPSQWLRFALDPAALALGTLTIPIPARGFPATPTESAPTSY